MMLSYMDARQPRMFPEYAHHPGHPGHPPHPGHMPPGPPGHHHPGMGHPHPGMGHPGHYPHRPRMDPASDVFTCLFGDLFVKW